MKTLMCNVLLTRRQEMCFIQDESGTLKWSGKQVHAAIGYLIDQGESEFLLVDGDDDPGIRLTACRVLADR